MRDEGDTDGSGDGDLALVKGQRRVLELVATGAPVGDTLDAVVGLVEARNPRLRCVVLVVNDDGTHFSRASGPSLPEDYRRVVEHLAITPPYLGSCGEAAHGGMPVAVPDVAADTRYPAAWRDLLARHGAASILSTPVRGRDGRVLASFAVLHDGSCAVCPHLVEVATSLLAIALQRRRDDDALQTQAARLQAVIETVPAAIWFTDARDGSAVVGNAEAARLVRMAQSANHSLTAPWPERPTHFRVLRDGVEIAPEMLAMQRAARGEEVAAEEQEIAFADGSWAIIDVRATPLRDAAGAVVGAVCAALDITERKRADMALRRSEEEFRALGEHLPNPCWMADANGWIYWYSRGWYDYTGTTQAEMAGWGWQSVHDPDVLPAVMRRWTGSVAAGEAFEMTFPLRGADGAFRPFLTRVVPVRDAAGSVTRWFGNNVDVSAQQANEAALRASEEALRNLNEQLEARIAAASSAREELLARLAQAQRMEALGQLASGMAHDFNNVLQAVTGGLGLLQRRADDPGAVRAIAGMTAEAASRGAAITGRLLAFARKSELRAAPIPPRALLQGLHDILDHTLGSMITVRTLVEPTAPLLFADRAQLETVLVNLAVNARDAMRDGGLLTMAASGEVVTEPLAHPAGLPAGSYVRVSLEDQGRGMDAGTLARAGEPFFTTKPVGEGTGLGLAMARGFAEQSGGALAIRSAQGQGTTVTLWLPSAPTG